jgi:hypothetical protein
MNEAGFDKALGVLLDGFAARGIRAAAIGGFAMALSGAGRSTEDLDFLVHRDDLPALDALMAEAGYARRFVSENVSQYAAADPALVSVDFLHAFRAISLAMLARAREVPLAGGSRRVKVLQPEDVIGLKIQALANNPSRRQRDLADIEALADAQGGRLDWERLKEFFGLFKRDEEFAALRARYPDA